MEVAAARRWDGPRHFRQVLQKLLAGDRISVIDQLNKLHRDRIMRIDSSILERMSGGKRGPTAMQMALRAVDHGPWLSQSATKG